MYRGNPHQDRNPFATKWRDRINTDRSLPPWRIKDNPKIYPGGTPPNPKNAFQLFLYLDERILKTGFHMEKEDG